MPTSSSNPTTSLTPELRRWVDETVRRQVESRLNAIFERAADELSRRAREDRDGALLQSFELREPGAGSASSLSNPLPIVAEIFEQMAGRASAGSRVSRPLPRPEADELPSTLPELRDQSLSAAEAADRLGVNASRIRQRLLRHTLYGFKDGGSWWVPEFQLTKRRVIPGLEKVIPVLRSTVSPVAVARWFVTPWEDLVVDEERETVVSPRTWLLEGRDPEPVAAQARLL